MKPSGALYLTSMGREETFPQALAFSPLEVLIWVSPWVWDQI